jgi:hypothetical protein
MHSTGDAEVLQDSLSSDVGSSSPELFGKRRLNQGHPAGHSLDLVSWREHPAVRALDQFAPSLASLASSPRPSFLRHYLTILQSMTRHEYIIPSRSAVLGLQRGNL